MFLQLAPNGATALTLVNDAVVTGYELMAEADWGNAVWETAFSGARGTQGALSAGGVPENRPVMLGVRVHGTSAVNRDDLLSALHTAGDAMRRFGGQIVVKLGGQSYRQYFDVMGNTARVREWGKVAEVNWVVETTFEVLCAPFIRGDPFDIRDDFSSNTIADYTFDTGGGTLSVSGDQLVPLNTADKRLYHSARGYTYSDVQATLKYTTGASIAATAVSSVVLRRVDASNELELRAYISSGIIQILQRVAGADTSLASTAATFAVNTTHWVRGRVESNVVTLEHWTTEPTPMGTPTATTSVVLTGAGAAVFGAGISGNAGLRLIPQATDYRYDDFTVEPFTYRNLTLPDYIRLNGSIPGDAPALADVTVTPSGGSAAPIFALLGWSERPLTHNLVWDGDFEEAGTDGWTAAAGSGFNVAATSIARVTTQKKFGTASMEVVVPATTNAGPYCTIYRRFKKGVTYTISTYVRCPSNVYIIAGVSGTDSSAGSTETPAGSVWTLIDTTWTPTADRDKCDVAIVNSAATAQTFHVDGVQVYEGTTAPTLGRHAEGAGAAPPFGIIEAEACDTGDLTGWVVAADAGSRGGFRLYDSANSGAETYTAGWWLDPALLVPDDYTQGEIDVEFWALMNLHGSNVNPKAILSARPEWGTSFGTERFTNEWQSAGVLLTKPSSGEARRFCRLGTITLPVDRSRPARWKLYFTGSTAAGSSGTFGMDYLDALPVRMRASSPSRKVNDSSYPKFVTSTSETSKTIASDLRGAISKPPFPAIPDHGLGQALLELPPGDVDMVVKLSSLVPDDPTSNTSTEQEEHAGTVHAAVTPRWHEFRGTD